MAALSQTAFESFQTVAHRQAEAARQAYEDGMRIMNSFLSAPNPQDRVMIQAEASKTAMEKCMANAREVSEAVSRYNTQAMETMTGRISDSLQELRSIVNNQNNRNAA